MSDVQVPRVGKRAWRIVYVEYMERGTKAHQSLSLLLSFGYANEWYHRTRVDEYPSEKRSLKGQFPPTQLPPLPSSAARDTCRPPPLSLFLPSGFFFVENSNDFPLHSVAGGDQ